MVAVGEAEEPATPLAADTAAGARADAEPAAATEAGEEEARRVSDRAAPPEGFEVEPVNATLARALVRAYYCEDREAFLSWSYRLLNLAVLVSGTAAFAALSQDLPFRAEWVAFATAVIGSVQLVFDIPGGMRLYAYHRRLATDVAAKAIADGADLCALQRELMVASAEMPPTFHAVEALAYNAAQCALGRPRETLLEVPWWKRRLRHLLRFAPNFVTAEEQKRAGCDGVR